MAAIAIPRFTGFTDRGKLAADEQYGNLIANATKVMIASGDVIYTPAAADGDIVITVTPGSGAVSGITNVTYKTGFDQTKYIAEIAKMVTPAKSVYWTTTMTVTIAMPEETVATAGTR